MKKKLLLLIIPFILLGFWLYQVEASDTGALSPGTMADDDTVGTIAWSNPNNAKASDNVYAVAIDSSGSTSYTHYLKATNFGFSIPSGATINGILAEIERYRSDLSDVYDSEVKIVKADGTIGTTNKASATIWYGISDPNEYTGYGSSSDLWGEIWTAENINDVDFGVVLSAKLKATGGPFGGRGNVDHIRITVYYTEAEEYSGKFQVRSGVLWVKSGQLEIK